MARTGHTKRLSHNDGAPGVRCLVNRGERPDALPDRTLLLGANANEEAWIIDEVHERQAERVAKVNKARHLFGGGCIYCARVERRVVSHDSDGDAVQAPQSADE